MALAWTSGHTDDGLAFLKIEGDFHGNGQKAEVLVMLEPKDADDMGTKLINAACEAKKAVKKHRPEFKGQEIIIPR